MHINIQNLGNIKEGGLNLSKRLTLFCGPNNSGKTYVSYVVYALLKARQFISTGELPNLSSLFTEGEDSFEINHNALISYRKQKISYFHKNLESVFGLSESDNKSLFSDLSISYVQSDKAFFEDAISHELNYVFPWDEFDVIVNKEKGSSIVKLHRDNPKSITQTDSFFLEWQIVTDIFERIINFPYFNACIFPVERNSIYTFNKELSIQRNELIEQMQALKDNTKIGYDSVDRLLGRSTRYPLAIRDCLSVANDLNNLQKRTSEYASFAAEMETGLLKGKVLVSKNGDVQFSPNSGKKLPIQISASIVKTLSSLTFYLKHIAQKDDLILIDEPEMNLHPDAQVILTRILARLINSGLNMLVSTHSDYIIRELNNLISLGSISNNESILAELGYQTTECINSDDVSVYLFKPIRKNSRFIQINPVFVKNDGFAIETIDEVICKSNEDSDRISYRMNYEQ